MAMMLRLFTSHPASIGESYGSHAFRALKTAARMMAAGAACAVHALFPFLFVHSASDVVTDLHAELTRVRTRQMPPAATQSQASGSALPGLLLAAAISAGA